MKNASEYDLKEEELDALREVANVGAGHAASALSQMTGKPIMISVPEIVIFRSVEVPHLWSPDEHLASVWLRVLGDVTGQASLVMPLANAHNLCSFLLSTKDTEEGDTFAEGERSALNETGNIVVGAYLTAMATFLKLTALPSVPEFVTGPPAEILNRRHEASDYPVMAIHASTEFWYANPDHNIKGHFLLLPDSASVTAILDAIRRA